MNQPDAIIAPHRAALALVLPLALAACCGCPPRSMPLDRAVQPDDAALLMQSDYAKAARTMQIAVAEYYSNFGKLPKSNADAGLPPPSEYRGDTLRSATIGADGSIEMVFDGKSGKQGGRVRLIPDLSHVAAMSVQWHCQSPDYPQIDHILRNCAYTGGESR